MPADRSSSAESAFRPRRATEWATPCGQNDGWAGRASTPWAWLQILANQIAVQRIEILKRNPMDAIDRTGVDGFLNAFGAVAVLTDGPGASEVRLHNKGVAGHMSAVTTADADGLIDPYRPFAKSAPKLGLTPGSFNRLVNRSRERQGRINRIGLAQASQRVTTSSIEPSCLTCCSAT